MCHLIDEIWWIKTDRNRGYLLWRGGRVAEGAPLLREYGVNPSIEGSNPSLSARDCCFETRARSSAG